MSDTLLKTVRITDNIKVEVYQQGKRRKYALFYDTDETKSEKYDVALTDDQVIHEALNAYNSKYGNYQKTFKVIQDPYKDPLPVRTYGGGTASPYYLNNGCKVNILWQGKVPNPAFTLGTYSNPFDAENADGAPDRYLTGQPITSSNEDAELTDFLPKSTWVVTGTFSSGSGTKIYGPDYRDTSYVSDKIATVTLPDGVKEDGDFLVWTQGGLQYNIKSIPENKPYQEFAITGQGYGVGGKPQDQIQYFGSTYKDSDIITQLINDFQSKVGSLNGISPIDYKLALCSPDTGSCSVIDYKSPLKSPNNTPAQTNANSTPPSPTQSVVKVKMTIDGLPKDLQIKAKENLPTFTIWTGDIPKTNNGAGNIDNFEDLSELDPEYTEGGYQGYEETGVTLEAWKIQGDVSNGQEDATTSGGSVGAPADIKPYSSFDQLIELAGKCARELGKNERVNAENMRRGYTKGIHGLCPQGTQAVLYALTGIKSLGQIAGNADWFSFKNPSTGNGRASFSDTGYFNDKIRISQNNGSWKGTYITDKSQWQVGDVVAMGYTEGIPYGHIQVWTGFSWMSDFKQGNSIQQNHVDTTSVAMWRLNSKGIAAINKQQGQVA